ESTKSRFVFQNFPDYRFSCPHETDKHNGFVGSIHQANIRRVRAISNRLNVKTALQAYRLRGIDVMPAQKSSPLVAVVMGSTSDWDTMRHSVELLDELGVPNEHKVLSAHRSPDATADLARRAAGRGVHVIIAGAGGAAHLAGFIAAYTWLP